MPRWRGCAPSRQEQYRKLRDVPAVTSDGVAIDLHMNAGLLVDLHHVAETGAVSVGLFRTELQFMLASRFPRMSEQETLYRTALDLAPGKPITFRTLDIGSDKVLPYMTQLKEENPALGWRAIRIGLDRPALLRSQLRAMLRAGAGRELRIMFPMIATSANSRPRSAMVDLEIAHLKRHGTRCRRPISSSASWSRCPRCSGSSTTSAAASIFCRSARTISCNISTLRIATTSASSTRFDASVAALPRRPEADRRYGARRVDAADALRRNRRQAA